MGEVEVGHSVPPFLLQCSMQHTIRLKLHTEKFDTRILNASGYLHGRRLNDGFLKAEIILLFASREAYTREKSY